MGLSKKTRRIRILKPKNDDAMMEIKLPLKIAADDPLFDKYQEKARSLLDLLTKNKGWDDGRLAWLRKARLDRKQMETLLAALVYEVVEDNYPWIPKRPCTTTD